MQRVTTWLVAFLVCLCLIGCADFGDGYAAYQRGHYATALQVWRPLANKGDMAAQNNLGLMYANGHGVAKDEAEAVRWYRKAADQGNAIAQNNLGEMCEYGRGVAASDTNALYWYRKAVQNPTADSKLKVRADNNLRRAELRLVPPLPPIPRPAAVIVKIAPVLEIIGGNNIRLKQGTHIVEGIARGEGIVKVTINDEVVPHTASGGFIYRRYFTVGETVLRITATNTHGQTSTVIVTLFRAIKRK